MPKPTPVVPEAVAAVLEQCRQFPEEPTEADRARIEAALASAETALAAHPDNAAAHHAVFCTLAKRTRLDGYRFRSLGAVSRLKTLILAALEIDPDYVEARIAYGTLLMNLPGLMGGDSDQAVRELERASTVAPGNLAAHLQLARAYQATFHPEAARAEATHALRLARQKADGRGIAAAEEILRELDR